MDKKISLGVKNAIRSSLLIIEDLISEIESIFKEKEKILLKIEKKMNQEKQNRIKENISQIRNILREIKNELNLEEERISDKAIINSRCAKMWEILNDMKGEKLKRYGSTSEEIKRYLDFKIKIILKLIDEIVDL